MLYSELLDCPDWDIYYWLTDKKPVPENITASALFQALKAHSKNEDREIRRMPEL